MNAITFAVVEQVAQKRVIKREMEAGTVRSYLPASVSPQS